MLEEMESKNRKGGSKDYYHYSLLDDSMRFYHILQILPDKPKPVVDDAELVKRANMIVTVLNGKGWNFRVGPVWFTDVLEDHVAGTTSNLNLIMMNRKTAKNSPGIFNFNLCHEIVHSSGISDEKTAQICALEMCAQLSTVDMDFLHSFYAGALEVAGQTALYEKIFSDIPEDIEKLYNQFDKKVPVASLETYGKSPYTSLKKALNEDDCYIELTGAKMEMRATKILWDHLTNIPAGDVPAPDMSIYENDGEIMYSENGVKIESYSRVPGMRYIYHNGNQIARIELSSDGKVKNIERGIDIEDNGAIFKAYISNPAMPYREHLKRAFFSYL